MIPEDLAARYLPAALAVAAGFARNHPDLADEFASAAGWGAFRGATWGAAAYVVPNVRRAAVRGCLNVLRAERRRRAREHAAARPAIARPAADLGDWLDGLPPDQARVLDLIYGRGMTHAEAASALGRHRQRITDLHARAIDRLRADIHDD